MVDFAIAAGRCLFHFQHDEGQVIVLWGPCAPDLRALHDGSADFTGRHLRRRRQGSLNARFAEFFSIDIQGLRQTIRECDCSSSHI